MANRGQDRGRWISTGGVFSIEWGSSVGFYAFLVQTQKFKKLHSDEGATFGTRFETNTHEYQAFCPFNIPDQIHGECMMYGAHR